MRSRNVIGIYSVLFGAHDEIMDLIMDKMQSTKRRSGLITIHPETNRLVVGRVGRSEGR